MLAAVDDVQEARGELRINSVGGHIGEELIADICSAFMQENPDVRIHLDFSSHRVDLIEEGFDVAFRMGKLEDASFVARKLTEIRMSTLASPRTLPVWSTSTSQATRRSSLLNRFGKTLELPTQRDEANSRCTRRWRFTV